jgi:hypothetical protein
MGRAILLVVVLISAIYAGIIINVQREMYKLPDVILDNFLSKEAENVNDYALRAAVRLGTESYILPTGVDTMTVHFTDYKQGNVEIEKIFYRRMPAGYYEAVTHIKGTLQGRELNYTGQIAYTYTYFNYDGPLVLYNEYNQQTHSPNEVPDQSEHPSGIPMEGYLTAVGTDFSNIIHYSPQGLDKYFTGGGGTHKCLEFGAAQTNGKNHIGAWVQVPNPYNANYDVLVDRINTPDKFTIAIYAKPERIKNNDRNVTNQGDPYSINNRGNTAVLYWAASDPYNSKYGEPGYSRPSAAIWYDNFNSANNTVTMHFGVTIADSTANGTYMEITRDNCPIYSNLNAGAWRMYTMVFNNGTLSAYYDTQLIETKTAVGGFTTVKPMEHGFTLGMRDIRVDGLLPTQVKHDQTNYMFYNGLLDQISFWDRPLTATEVENWFNNYVDESVKYYIRD